MQSLVARERERVGSLLHSTEFDFVEGAPEVEASQIGALAGWRFRTTDDLAEADVYVFDSAEARQAALERFAAQQVPDPTWGLPAVSSNGPLVFVVRYFGPSDDAEAAFRVLGIASALAGEEE